MLEEFDRNSQEKFTFVKLIFFFGGKFKMEASP